MRSTSTVVEFWNKDRAANRSPEVISAIERRPVSYIEIPLRIEHFIPNKFIEIAVELIRSRSCSNDRRSIASAWILSSIVGCEDFDLLNRVDAWRNDKRAVIFVNACIEGL